MSSHESVAIATGADCEACPFPITKQADEPVVFHNADTGTDIVYHDACLPEDLRAILEAHTRAVSCGG
jgi:hypothetical protein